jgi:serine/threonine protein kinase
VTIGQLLKNRYRVVDKIGVGGMSTVYLARVHETGQTVAVKVMNDTFAFDTDYTRRFAQELAIARLLIHPGIPRLIDDGETEDGVPFIVMEYVQGITLTEYVRQKGPLPIEEAVAITSQVLTILAYAYSKGIQAHRDIKPGNIMIDLRTHVVTVMDFGIAKTVGSSLTHSTVLYTPKYAAPEQLLPSKFGGVVDKRADLYALGVVLYEMLTGKAPFTGETPAEISGEQIKSSPPSPSTIRRDIPAPLSQILLTCLQPNPSARYQTPEDLLQDLTAGHVRETRQTPSPARDDQPTVIGKGVPAPPVSGWEVTPAPKQELPPPRRRSRVLIPLLLTLLVAAIVPVTVMVLRNTGDNPTAVTPSQETAMLTVTSTPSGAEVFLDGVSIGTTPITSKTATPGVHRLLLTLSGYDDYADYFALESGDTEAVAATLTKTAVIPTTGTLTVTSTPSGAEVLLGGTSIGNTPITKRTVTPGTYTLWFLLPGYDNYSASVLIQAGDTKAIAGTLTRNGVTATTATLSITSAPSGARVFLDGKDTGKVTPSTVALGLGTHVVKITKDGYSDYQGSVQLTQARMTKSLPVTLTKTAVTPTTGTLSVTSIPAGARIYLDGKDTGKTTPGEFYLPQGAYDVRLAKDGYYDDTSTAKIERAGAGASVLITLRKRDPLPTTATLTVTSTPSEARIQLDGKDTGKTTPGTFTLSTGTHVVGLVKDGYEAYQGSIQLTEAGMTRTFSVILRWSAQATMAAPVLLSPADPLEDTMWSDKDNVFEWNSVPGATSYEILFKSSSGALACGEGGLTETTYTLSAGRLSGGTVYSWTVTASDGTTSGPASLSRRFGLARWGSLFTSPERDDTTLLPWVLGSALFTWSSVPSADSYSFGVYTLDETEVFFTDVTMPRAVVSSSHFIRGTSYIAVVNAYSGDYVIAADGVEFNIGQN